MNSLEIRKTILEVASEYFDFGTGYFNKGVILKETAKRLGILIEKSNNDEAELMDEFDRLFKDNVFAAGRDVYYPELPFMRLTAIGAEILKKDRRIPL